MSIESSPASFSAESRPSFAARLLVWPQLATCIVLMLLVATMAVSPGRAGFLSSANLQNIALQTSLIGIFAIGETIVIITGGIDLSLGSLIAFSSMLLGMFVTTLDAPALHLSTSAAIYLGILLTLLVSLGLGSLHAVLIHRVRLPAFVVTLVSLLVLKSQSFVMYHEQQIPLPTTKYPLFDKMANGSIPLPFPLPVGLIVLIASLAILTVFGVFIVETIQKRKKFPVRETIYVIAGIVLIRIALYILWKLWQFRLDIDVVQTIKDLYHAHLDVIPIPTVILLLVAVAASIILSQTRMGRYLFSMGNNEQATMLSGVNTFKVKLFAYGASALLGGLAGILFAGYGHQGDPQIGVAYELAAVAAAVVGGANLTGGRGSILGTIVGACLLYSISNAINLSLSTQSWRETVVGAVLLLAVLIGAAQKRLSRAPS